MMEVDFTIYFSAQVNSTVIREIRLKLEEVGGGAAHHGDEEEGEDHHGEEGEEEEHHGEEEEGEEHHGEEEEHHGEEGEEEEEHHEEGEEVDLHEVVDNLLMKAGLLARMCPAVDVGLEAGAEDHNDHLVVGDSP